MKLRITVEGKSYEVDVEVLDDRVSPGTSGPSAPVNVASSPPPVVSQPQPPPSGLPWTATGERVVKAPIVGTILQLKVAPGDMVTTNQVLLVMEAMKMGTNVASPLEGKIKAILVAPGEAVKAGQALIEIE